MSRWPAASVWAVARRFAGALDGAVAASGATASIASAACAVFCEPDFFVVERGREAILGMTVSGFFGS